MKIAIYLTDNYELKQYIRYFRESLNNASNELYFISPSFNCDDLTYFQEGLLKGEKILNVSFPLNRYEKRVAVTCMSSAKVESLRYVGKYFPLSNRVHPARGPIKRVAYRIVSFFLIPFLAINKVENSFKDFDLILLFRPDSLYAYLFGLSRILRRKTNVFIRNVDSLPVKGLLGSYERVYVKDRLSELICGLLYLDNFKSIYSLNKAVVPKVKSVMIALGDTVYYKKSIDALLGLLESDFAPKIRISLLVHPNDVKRGAIRDVKERLQHCHNIFVRHTMNDDPSQWDLLVPIELAYSQLLEYSSFDLLLEVGTTISNEGQFSFVVAFVPVYDIMDGTTALRVWREHNIYQYLKADRVVFTPSDFMEIIQESLSREPL